MRQDGERLQDILEAIGQIERYALRGKDAFQTDELYEIRMNHHTIGSCWSTLCRNVSKSHRICR
jgi:uncharacterized protein with HEPN domain